MRKIMASLDVGSSTVKLIVGEVVKKNVNILAVAEAKSQGVQDGLIIDPNSLLLPIKEVVHKCEDIIGLRIKQVIVTTSGKMADFVIATGMVPINNEGNLITGGDVVRVIKKAISSFLEDDKEYLSLMPTSFTIDDDRVVKDPKGLTSKTLSVRGVLISEPKECIYPILSILDKLGIDVLDISLGAIGDYYEYKNKDTSKNVGVVVNLGHQTTDISIFNKGVLTNTQIMDLGGFSVDKDIAYVYKISNEEAKRLKEEFSLGHSRLAQANDQVIVKDKNGEDIKINQFEISEVVESRLRELLNLVKKQINLLTKKEISYIIFTGGLTEIRDFKLILEEVIGENVTCGVVKEIGVRNNKYGSCVGMIKYYADKARLKDKDFSIFSIDEQQILSGASLEVQDENMIGKLFGYFFQ